MIYNIHYGPGRPVRRLVVQGPHEGDVVYARPGTDHDSIRLIQRWEPRAESLLEMEPWPRDFSRDVIMYYRATFYIRAGSPWGSIPAFVVDAYVRPGFFSVPEQWRDIPHLVRLQLTAEALLTA